MNVLLVNFKESSPPCENDCICLFSSSCFGRKWYETLGKTIKKTASAVAARRGSVRWQTKATKETKGVRDIPLDLTVSNACQPRIRPLRAATDWQLAPGLDYTLEWQRLNKGNAWREAEGTHRAENQFITLSVRGRRGQPDRDTAREEKNGHRGEIKVGKERYKDKCDWLGYCKHARYTGSCSVGGGCKVGKPVSSK